MIAHRDAVVARHGLELIVAHNAAAFTTASRR
jgi:hypothetical protein